MRYIVTTPWWLRILFPSGLLWKVDTKEKVIHLTFDDGPHPEQTPFVLEELKKYGALATFFCIGKNVRAHPDIYHRILAEGHRIGNHTYHHSNGRKVKEEDWLNDVREASFCIDSNLFRPPYGAIRRFSARALQKASPPYRIVMWDVLSGDFDGRIDGKACTRNVIRNAKEGSIVVFHDSEKAGERLRIALPEVLQYFTAKGFRFLAL